MNKLKYYFTPVLISLLLSSCVNSKPTYPIPNEISITVNDVDLTNYDIHTDWQKEFLQSSDKDQLISETIGMGRTSNSKPNPIKINWTESNDKNVNPTKQVLSISENGEFNDPSKTMRISLGSEVREYDLYNFKINTQYQYRIENMYGSKAFNSEAKSFTVNASTPRNYYVDGVENVRDLGGYDVGSSFTYKQGLLYRCGRLSASNTGKVAITELGKSQFVNELKVKTEIDLRKTSSSVFSDNENGGLTSSPAGSSVNYVSCPMDYAGRNPFTYEENKAGIRSFFETLSNVNNYPIAFHCSIGTDRTGGLAYIIGAMLGVSEEELMTDYLFSNLANINGTRLSTVITADNFYVKGINESEGSTLMEKATNYLVSNVGVSLTTINTIKSILLETK